MRAEVDASFQHWVQSQPECWSDYQRRAEEARAEMMAASGMYNSYGSGGLGISGVGSGYGSGIGLGSVASGASVSASGSSAPRRAASASGTNNQVVGVDEADIVKSDGRYVYFAMNGALRIVEAMNPRVLSTTKLPGNVREMFVQEDRAVVYVNVGTATKRCTYGYDCTFAGDGSSTRIIVIDLHDRRAPRILRTLELSGSLMAARRIGNTIHTVVADGDSPFPAYETWPPELETCGTREPAVRAKFAQLKRDNEQKLRALRPFATLRESGADRQLCSGLLRTGFSDGKAMTTIVSFDLRDDVTPAVTATVQSRPGAVFASANALYLSVGHRRHEAGGRWYSFYRSVDEASEIHKFRIGASPKETGYVGSGIVPGRVLNQFSMDEWYGYLRVATTRGRVPDPNASSAVSVLAEGSGGNLVRVGAIEGIAPGEDIRAVRFDDDRGYIVTFKKTDPLFVIDLHNPAQPAILGELKIPGFSTYMHRIDPDHLLSIGLDANDHGNFAYFDGVILQLFDVRNPTEPKLIHKEKIGTRGSSSEAVTDHLAFNYFAEKGLLAIPMTVCEGGGDGTFGSTLAFSGLLVYNVSVSDGFTRLGGVDHGTHGADCNTWWSNANSAVKRSLFLDDLVYSIATDRVKVQRMGHFGQDLADISLLGTRGE